MSANLDGGADWGGRGLGGGFREGLDCRDNCLFVRHCFEKINNEANGYVYDACSLR